MTKTLSAWSYSRWDLHHQCPLKFKLEVLDGNKSPASPAMEKGLKAHKAIAAYLLPLKEGEAYGLPPKEAGHASDLVAELTQFDDRVVEQQWGYTRQWTPTGWFSADTWLRSVLDAAVMYEDMSAEVIDWKTGKPRGTHEDQMELFAISLMARYEPVTHVTTRLAYTDFRHEEFGEYSREDLPKLIAKWEAKVRPMFEDREFLPRPSDACKWCQFSRSNGGPCRYG